MPRVLIVGESWISQSTHIKGFDQFESSAYHTGVGPLRDALSADGHEVVHLAAHSVAAELPDTADGLDQYEVIMLSDIGADTILLSPRTFLEGQITGNRLALMRDWVMAGGGLAMARGYLSFQGIGGRARYRRTRSRRCCRAPSIPGTIEWRCPRGPWPRFSKTITRSSRALAQIGRPCWAQPVPSMRGRSPVGAVRWDPILAVRQPGGGRTLIWTLDIGPHWCPEAFVT